MNLHQIQHFQTESETRSFVASCDRRLEEDLITALNDIQKTTGLRFFGLTGPTCSGKTTAARKMTELLEAQGLSVHMVSLDDFYYDKEYLHRRADADPDIEIDYDSEETIDIACFTDCMNGLLSGKPTFLPHFDFESGTRMGGRTLTPGEKDVFLFEGIQILYPRIHAVFDQIPGYRSLAIYPSSAIAVGGEVFEPNEIRFYRRLVRDYRHRATEVSFTAYLWESVRANEESNIFPFLHLCHIHIDSTMPYEIGILKPYLIPLLKEISPDCEFYNHAQKIIKKLESVPPVSSDYLTENSLYKEFI